MKPESCFVLESTYPNLAFSLLESIRCHSTDEYLVYGTEDEVNIGYNSYAVYHLLGLEKHNFRKKSEKFNTQKLL